MTDVTTGTEKVIEVAVLNLKKCMFYRFNLMLDTVSHRIVQR